jgi:steroid delta-isomerase-like uncharacterized protein
MSVEENKAIARRFWEEQDRRRDIPDELCASNFTAYFPGSPPMDLMANKQFAAMFFSAFPDLKHVIEDMVAEEDKVTVRLTARGTHKGDLMGIPPTGNQMAVSATVIVRVTDGKIAEEWAIFDQMGLMQQIGAIPAPAQAG